MNMLMNFKKKWLSDEYFKWLKKRCW